MRVLLVDDHEIVWNGTRLLLERMAADIEPGVPFHFEAVRDAEAACALDADAFDLVLLDYHLPGLSGLDALRAVKARHETVPVCMQSAESSPRAGARGDRGRGGGLHPQVLPARGYGSRAAAGAAAPRLPAGRVRDERRRDARPRARRTVARRSGALPARRAVAAPAPGAGAGDPRHAGQADRAPARRSPKARSRCTCRWSIARWARATAPRRCAACSMRRPPRRSKTPESRAG